MRTGWSNAYGRGFHCWYWSKTKFCIMTRRRADHSSEQRQRKRSPWSMHVRPRAPFACRPCRPPSHQDRGNDSSCHGCFLAVTPARARSVETLRRNIRDCLIGEAPNDQAVSSVQRPSAGFSGFAGRERPQKAFDAEVGGDPVGFVSGIDAIATQQGVVGAGGEVLTGAVCRMATEPMTPDALSVHTQRVRLVLPEDTLPQPLTDPGEKHPVRRIRARDAFSAGRHDLDRTRPRQRPRRRKVFSGTDRRWPNPAVSAGLRQVELFGRHRTEKGASIPLALISTSSSRNKIRLVTQEQIRPEPSMRAAERRLSWFQPEQSAMSAFADLLPSW